MKFYGLLVLITCLFAVLKADSCKDELEEAQKMVKQGVQDYPVPSCSADGTYAPQQYGSFGNCYCVDPNGNRVDKKCPCS
uniref:Thyroglobulin type-1 domain-containing protein n=1 Tax=Parasteatoda tepidariorum TaxID=114398 RepID=A0A2L2Y1R5_PARTP